MNITEFAEQVVFGTTIEDKLLRPGRLTHDVNVRTRPNVDALTTPGRPTDLKMHTGAVGAQPPSDDQLGNEQSRGQLLHFLANHELLATELMALVLLKFPDAPHAFRQGVLVTLQEEQEHTRMYLRRMKECGVEFGSYPVSGQFWRIVEPMQSPIDFVSRLSLTFEQANLDYSLHFASVFKRLGDLETASVLQQIYEDEIGHVQHGLHWFRQWKNPEQSDWEAYQAALEFPMSPQRARGPRATFNREGRERAGLTEDFIDAIEVFRQSRGRSPSVRWFDPAAESSLAGKLSDRERWLTDQLGRDLELVMVAMAREDDVQLVRRVPSRDFAKQLIIAGFDLPEFILFEDKAELVERKLHDLAPWAWTPDSHDLAEPLIPLTHVAHGSWADRQVDLYRKSWGAERLREWLVDGEAKGEIPDGFVSSACAGITVRTLDEVSSTLKELAERGYTTALVKQDLAASGRGQRRLPCDTPLSDKDESWLRVLFATGTSPNQPVAVVEPELNRLLDVSFLWHMPHEAGAAEGPNYLGWTRPLITSGRRYAGTRLRRMAGDDDDRLRRFVLPDRSARLQAAADWLSARIGEELRARNFHGFFGVDALICEDAAGELKLKPLVELNPRMTMGHIALRLEKRLAPGVDADFRIFSRLEWLGIQKDSTSLPLVKSRDGRWESGIVRLGEVEESTKFVPAVVVGVQTRRASE